MDNEQRNLSEYHDCRCTVADGQNVRPFVLSSRSTNIWYVLPLLIEWSVEGRRGCERYLAKGLVLGREHSGIVNWVDRQWNVP